MIPKTRAILLGQIMAIAVLVSAGYSQEIKSRRDAVGAARASAMEALLHALFPDAEVQWDPVLGIRRGSASPQPVDLGDFTATSDETGLMHGVAMLEVGTAKADRIEKLKKFQSSEVGNFETTLVAFRAAGPGSGLETRTVALDPNDPLTKIDWFDVRHWPPGGWPVLRLGYDSFAANGQAVAILEWDSLFNIATGSFEGRIPMGITVLYKDGKTREAMFSQRRTGPKQIAIHDNSTGKTIDYACGDPCTVDGPTFLGLIDALPEPAALNRRRGDFAQPGHAVPDNNSAATIHLKNGRMIHADTAHETADKVEYSIGESDYQIPKSLVQEIVRTVETPSNPQNGGTDVQLSVQAQPNHSPCKRKAVSSDVKIPCYTGFWVSVLMGLGETQRFALFDNAGHDVTAQAEWAILDYGSQVDFSVINGVPHIFSKKYGMVTLYATVGDNSAMAQIYVSKPDEITSNTLGRKGAPAFLDSHRPLQLVPAEPYIGRIQ